MVALLLPLELLPLHLQPLVLVTRWWVRRIIEGEAWGGSGSERGAYERLLADDRLGGERLLVVEVVGVRQLRRPVGIVHVARQLAFLELRNDLL